MRTDRRLRTGPETEIRSALVALMWAVRALNLPRRDARRASVDAALERARRALHEPDREGLPR